MRTIEGIVCTAVSDQPVFQERLFGPNTGGFEFNHQTFLSNGLVPFETTSQALESLNQLRSRRQDLDIVRLGLAEVQMRMAESDREFEELYKVRKLIVVTRDNFDTYLLLGKKVPGTLNWGHIPGTELELNGFKVFDRIFKKNFNLIGPNMLGILYEVRRQARPAFSTLSTFRLKRLNLRKIQKSVRRER